MPETVSEDGTPIVYDRTGSGPPLILVDGAFGSRGFGPMPKLAAALAKRFTVVNYDRRGRGQSGDTPPYAPAREIEDLRALIDVVGGETYLYGFSSGAILAFRAAARLGSIVRRLALYEPPLAAPDGRSPLPSDYRERLIQMVASGRREEAVKLFLREAVGMTPSALAAMQKSSAWSGLETAAASLPYDIAVQVEAGSGKPLPAEFIDPIVRAGTQILVITGDRSPEWLGRAARAIADALPKTRFLTLANQTHDVKAESLAPALLEFFAS